MRIWEIRPAFLLRGRFLVHVRELYEKEGELLPGKKGVTLDEGAISALIEHADEITSVAQRCAGNGPASGPGAATAAAAPSVAAAAPPPARRDAPPSTVAAASGSATAAPGPVDLGSNKRAAVTSFKGATYVDLREFYSVSRGVSQSSFPLELGAIYLTLHIHAQSPIVANVGCMTGVPKMYPSCFCRRMGRSTQARRAFSSSLRSSRWSPGTSPPSQLPRHHRT